MKQGESITVHLTKENYEPLPPFRKWGIIRTTGYFTWRFVTGWNDLFVVGVKMGDGEWTISTRLISKLRIIRWFQIYAYKIKYRNQ